ncbi:MAG: hypothetical protein ACREOE_02955, partial [Gemmatimonadales bacterium]
MSVWGALAGGFAGTAILTTLLRVANEAGLTRMDLPFLLGSVFCEDRRKASLLGYGINVAIGVGLSLGFGFVFAAVGNSRWWFGALLGVAHASLMA